MVDKILPANNLSSKRFGYFDDDDQTIKSMDTMVTRVYDESTGFEYHNLTDTMSSMGSIGSVKSSFEEEFSSLIIKSTSGSMNQFLPEYAKNTSLLNLTAAVQFSSKYYAL